MNIEEHSQKGFVLHRSLCTTIKKLAKLSRYVTASQDYERMPRQTVKHKEKSSMEKAVGDQK